MAARVDGASGRRGHDGGAPLGVPNPCALWTRGAREKRTILCHSAVPECHTWAIPRQAFYAGSDGAIRFSIQYDAVSYDVVFCRSSGLPLL